MADYFAISLEAFMYELFRIALMTYKIELFLPFVNTN